MGENQGMIWIILGVIVVATVLMLLGNTMSTAIGSTASEIESQAGTATEEKSE